MNYLIQDDKREHVFMRRIGSFWLYLSDMLISLGINPHFCWALLEIDMPKLTTSLIGEVDILVGNMAWRDPQVYATELNTFFESRRSLAPLPEKQPGNPNEQLVFQARLIDLVSPENSAADSAALKGGFVWPPPTDYLIGIEVKFACLNKDVDPQKQPVSEKDMPSTKSSYKKTEGIRLEINKLIQLGCDRVALLDLIANPPADGINLGAWFNAMRTAKQTLAAMERILGERLKTDSIAGHWAYSLGAVAGEDETIRTSIPAPIEVKASKLNDVASNAEILNRRSEVEANLKTLFASFSKPTFLPALFIDCRICKTIHWCSEFDSCNSK